MCPADTEAVAALGVDIEPGGKKHGPGSKVKYVGVSTSTVAP